jgi:hypothetical protein
MALSDWLTEHGATHVAMEGTDVYWQHDEASSTAARSRLFPTPAPPLPQTDPFNPF